MACIFHKAAITSSHELLQSVISELVKRYVVMNQRRDNDDMTSPTS